jgi:drug/metabolite transporter (DMT)-like permease
MTLAVWWIACLIWSSVWLFIKIGLRDLPPVTFAAVRLAVAVAVFLPILLARRVALPRRADWQVIAVAGLLLLGVTTRFSSGAHSTFRPA